jgi:hypothetical protein
MKKPVLNSKNGQARPHRNRNFDHLSSTTVSLANLKSQSRKTVQHGLFTPKAGRR